MKNKVVIITGASSGIGLACARNFASKGADVVLAARTKITIENEANKLVEKGYSALAVQTDVTKEEDCKNLIDRTLSEFNRIDILVNNAGISMRGLFIDLDLSVMEKLMNVNFWGAVYCTKYALPHLIQQKGSVVGITSIAGFHGLPGRTGYSASKFAMHGFLETLRIEHLKSGLHVMIAAPGFTASNVRKAALGPDGNPQGISPRNESKMMSAEAVAEKIARGIVKRRRNIIISAEGMITVFLQRIVPKVLDKLFYNHLSKEPNSPLK